MGNEMSTPGATPLYDENSVSGLLPVKQLSTKCCIIENLVFASGGVQVFAYAGAVRVLEKNQLLKGIRRFSGVGAGAIVAALLALGFNSQELQELFDKYFDSLIMEEQKGNEDLFGKLSTTYGWNTGSNFLDLFAKILETKSYDGDITFSQLYEKTDKELCIVLTNIDKVRIEYFHQKTTPDFAIRRAVLASIAIPGIFTPLKFGLINENHYVHGGLMNSFPINSFDGWWLSMEKEDSFVRKFDSSSALDTAYSTAFNTRTARSLGFLLIDKYEEGKYKEFRDRLRHCGADMAIPDSNLGEKYKTSWQGRMYISRSYDQLRGVCLQLVDVASSCENETGVISLDTLADKILCDKYFNQTERILISPECGKTKDECLAFLKGISADTKLTSVELMTFLKRRVLILLEEYPCDSTTVADVHTYFRSVFEVQHKSGENLTHADYNRTVGIYCGHVSSGDKLTSLDRVFLYRQGWNATVVHLQDPCVYKSLRI